MHISPSVSSFPLLPLKGSGIHFNLGYAQHFIFVQLLLCNKIIFDWILFNLLEIKNSIYKLLTATLCIAAAISLIKLASFSMALPTTITSAPALQFK
jgi:hypothetical protein